MSVVWVRGGAAGSAPTLGSESNSAFLSLLAMAPTSSFACHCISRSLMGRLWFLHAAVIIEMEGGGFHCEQEVVCGRCIENETIAFFHKVKIRRSAVESMGSVGRLLKLYKKC